MYLTNLELAASGKLYKCRICSYFSSKRDFENHYYRDIGFAVCNCIPGGMLEEEYGIHRQGGSVMNPKRIQAEHLIERATVRDVLEYYPELHNLKVDITVSSGDIMIRSLSIKALVAVANETLDFVENKAEAKDAN